MHCFVLSPFKRAVRWPRLFVTVVALLGVLIAALWLSAQWKVGREKAIARQLTESGWSFEVTTAPPNGIARVLLWNEPRKRICRVTQSVNGRGMEDYRWLCELPYLTLLYIRDPMFDDEALRWLAECKMLEVVWVPATSVTDRGLRHLSSLRQLKSIQLRDTQVHNDGLEALAVIPALEFVGIGGTDVTDKGLASFNGTSISAIDLDATRVTGDFLRDVNMPSLTYLSMAYSAFIGSQLRHIEKFKYLSHLDISGTMVQDDDLRHLSDLIGLTELRIADTDITDAGVNHLPLKQLTFIDIRGTHVTENVYRLLLEQVNGEVMWGESDYPIPEKD